MRASVFGAFLAAAVAGAGCMPREKLAPGELDRYWYLQPNVWADAQPRPLIVGGRQLPTRWVFRHDPSLIWATVSMVRAADALKAGAGEVEVRVSDAHARMLADILAQGRRAVLNLKSIADPDDPPTPQQWSRAAADALIVMEKVARLASEQPGRGADEPLGWSAGPMLQMAVGYLNERTGGSLLAEMGGDEVAALREVLAQVVLRLAFAVAGKRDPPGLRAEITDLMRQSPRPGELAKSLRAVLLSRLRDAPPAEAGGQLRSLVRAVVSGTPAMLEVLESFVRQWDRMDSLAMELRWLGDRTVVAVTVKTQPRREVRLAKLHFMAPAVVFRGGSRIVVLPKVGTTGETVVLFEPVEGGATEVRFEGAGYGLVRLLALPLADGALREVRVATSSAQRGRRMVSVAMLMEARGGRKDPRRLIAFQDVRRRRVVREAFDVRAEDAATEQVFNYLTPTHRYTYRRVKGPADK